jgi:hypothetical protein
MTCLHSPQVGAFDREALDFPPDEEGLVFYLPRDNDCRVRGWGGEE